MAEAFARMHGDAAVEAYSAGSLPSGIVNPKAIAAMRVRGYDLAAHRSKSIDDLPNVDFDVVVTMGCGDACPNVRARVREDWEIPDPKHLDPEDFSRIRDLIESKVLGLLRKISA